MAAEIGQESQGFQRILAEDEYAGGQPLEPAEDLEHVFAVITDRHGLAIRSDVDEFLDDLPGPGVDHHAGTVVGSRIQHRDEHLAAVDRETEVERAGEFAHPGWVLHIGDFLPVQRIRIGGVEHRHVVLLDVVHHGVVPAIGGESRFMADALDVIEMTLPDIRAGGDPGNLQHARRAFRVVQYANRLPCGAVDDDRRGQHADDQGGVTVAGMMHHGVQAGEAARIGAGQFALFDQVLGHRHHFPVDLVAARAFQVEFAGFLGLDQAREAQGAALGPVFL